MGRFTGYNFDRNSLWVDLQGTILIGILFGWIYRVQFSLVDLQGTILFGWIYRVQFLTSCDDHRTRLFLLALLAGHEKKNGIRLSSFNIDYGYDIFLKKKHGSKCYDTFRVVYDYRKIAI